MDVAGEQQIDVVANVVKTRLSLDFRVVPRSHFLEHYENSHHPNGRARFGIDAFYALLEPLGGPTADVAQASLEVT